MGKTKKILSKIPVLATTFFLTSSLIFSSNVNSNGETPRFKSKIETIVSSQKFPEEFEFFYKASEGQELQGNFRLGRKSDTTYLKINVNHLREKKEMEFFEYNQGDSVFYSECQKDLKKDKIEYNSTFAYSIKNKPKTLFTLIEDFFAENLNSGNFFFKGQNEKMQKFEFKIKENYAGYVEAEIKNNDCRISNIKVFYEQIKGKRIPVEIRVDYRFKWFPVGVWGSNYVTRTLKATLAEEN